MIDFAVYNRVLERIGSPITTGLDAAEASHQKRLESIQQAKESDPLLNFGDTTNLPASTRVSSVELKRLTAQLRSTNNV